MISRFKQLYNGLTHSKAYDEKTGVKDHSKINKKTFTPHNLKALLIGPTRAIAVHYTTNDADRTLVRHIDYVRPYVNAQGQVNPELFKKELDEKGLIFTLTDGLKFNYVEEIVLFQKGFDENEWYKEMSAIQSFVDNSNITNSMKRLKTISIVKGKGINEITKYNKDESVLRNLGYLGMPYDVVCKFKPEKTELGLLVNRGLDGVEYAMDTKYDPNNEDDKGKVECRLSRYFYEEEQKAKARKLYELKVDYANDLWVKVKPIYEELYRNGVENGLLGILTPEGLYTFRKDVDNITKGWLKKLAEGIFGTGSKFKSTKILEKDLTTQTLNDFNYFARFHLFNAFGVVEENKTSRKWDVVIGVIEKRFKQMVISFFENESEGELQRAYIKILNKMTNCIVIEEFNRDTCISMKYKMEGMDDSFNQLIEKNSQDWMGVQNCQVMDSSISKNKVVTMFGVFDAEKFALEPLFSYQAYDKFVSRGGKVGLDKVIVGRKLNGSDVEFSLKSNDTRITAIFAGSGSGKGVMTLGLLSAIVANKVPFIYLDYKPDMAEMLWNIEHELKKSGITRTDGSEARILAIDSKQDMDACNPVRKHRFGENLPSYLSEIPNTTFAVLPYLKLLQLYYILGSLRANEENKPAYGGAMTFAILDEFQTNMKDNLSNLISTLESEMKMAKKKKDSKEKDIEAYNMKITTLIQRLAKETGTFINTDGRKSQCRAIYLGQNADYSVWQKDKVAEVAELTSEWYTKTSYRFFGRNGGTGSYAPSPGGVISGFVNNEDTFGYWTSAIGAGKVDKIKDWPVFKAYSVLNENDYNIDNPESSGRCTTGVLNNLNNETIQNYVKNEVFTTTDENGNKAVRPEVGFLGLVKKLSGFSDNELADALSEGYEVIWKVMCKYGLDKIYPDIESYLFDASLESIYTINEIKQGISNIKKNPSSQSSSTDDSDLVFKSDGDIYLGEEDDDTLEDLTGSTSTYSPSDAPSGTPSDNPSQFHQTKPQPVSQPKTGSEQIYSQQPSQRQVQGQEQGQQGQFRQQPQQSQYSQPSSQSQGQNTILQRRQELLKQVGKNNGVYTKPLHISDNPFKRYNGDSNTNTLLSVKDMTQILKEDIENNLGPFDYISEFGVSHGVLLFNGIAYAPQFDNDFISSLPVVLQQKVILGQLVEFFDLGTVYKFKNLQSFSIEDEGLAQGRARKEMGIGFRKRWSCLFKKFDYLNYIKVGHSEYVRENPDTDVEKGFLDRFKNNPESTFAQKSRNTSMMDKVWDSKPVRVVTGALGWTVGVQAVWMLAGLMGPWGLLFGGLAMAGAYKELKGSNSGQQRLPQSTSNNTNQNRGQSKSQGSSGKKKK